MMPKKMLLFILCAVFSFSDLYARKGVGKKKNFNNNYQKKKMVNQGPIKIPEWAYDGFHTDLFTKSYQKNWKLAVKNFRKTSKRFVANNIDGEALLSKEFKSFRGEILNAKNVDSFRNIVNKAYTFVESCSKNAKDPFCKNTPNDLKFLKLQIAMLRPMEGIMFRLRPYVSDHPAPHSSIVTLMRRLGNNAHILDRSAQVKATFDFAAQPSPRVKNSEIKSDHDLRQYVGGELITANVIGFKFLKTIDFSKRIISDKKVYFGDRSYTSNFQRYVAGDRGDHKALLSRMARGIGRLFYMTSYDMTQILDVTTSVGALHGYAGVGGKLTNSMGLGSFVDGATAKERAAVIRKHSGFLKLDPDIGRKNMETSYKYYANAIYYGKQAWDIIKHRKETDRNLFRGLVLGGFDDFVDSSVDTLVKAIPVRVENGRFVYPDPGSIEFISAVDGTRTRFDIHEFFHNPPRDLKAFLPTQFKSGYSELKAHGKSYRNYLKDSSTGWKTSEFAPYFPSVKSQGVPKVIKTLRNSHGSGMIRGLRLPLLL